MPSAGGEVGKRRDGFRDPAVVRRVRTVDEEVVGHPDAVPAKAFGCVGRGLDRLDARAGTERKGDPEVHLSRW